MLPESYNLMVGEIINYYQDIQAEEEIISEDNRDEFRFSLLKLDIILSKMKSLHKLPNLDNGIVTLDILIKSFINTDDNNYFRPVDYEYYFLIYSLLMHNSIINMKLIEIIQAFFQKTKIRKHLSYPDVERTDTGSVRCKTNLRFAIHILRELGLVNYYEKGKRAWSLTLPGFLLAAHICINKPFRNFDPYSFHIQRLRDNEYCYYHMKLDKKIITAVSALSDIKNINKILGFVYELDKHKGIINICRDIFCDYRDFLIDPQNEKLNLNFKRNPKNRKLSEFLEQRNRKYGMEIFKCRFSELINADKFLNDMTEQYTV